MRVEVSDGAAGFPTPPEQVPDAPHGRGLHIVRALADAWGIEMRRDRPGKTVWFSLPLSAAGRRRRRWRPWRPDARPDVGPGRRAVDDGPEPDRAAGAGTVSRRPRRPANDRSAAGNDPAWPVPGVRVVLDGLRDAVVATDDQGTIRYVNQAAEDLLGWPRGHPGRPARLRPRARFADRRRG